MIINEKILMVLKSAITYVETSMLALNKKDDNSFANGIWHVAAELEYLLFLFSITYKNESDTSIWNRNIELKKIETYPMLIEVQNLLNEAEKFVVNEKFQYAYKNVYIARHYILRVQQDITKKKRGALKKE